MKVLFRYLVGVLAIFLSIATGYWAGRHQAPTSVQLISIDNSFLMGYELNWPSIDNQHLAEAVHIGGYKILSPVLPKDITSDNTLMIFGRNNDVNVEIDPNMVQVIMRLGKPDTYHLGVIDLDRKGIYDAVQYDIFDNAGIVIGKVIDIDRDGQADMKLYRGDGGNVDNVFFHIDGSWYRRKQIDNNFFVTVGGKERLIKKVGRKFVFAK